MGGYDAASIASHGPMDTASCASFITTAAGRTLPGTYSPSTLAATAAARRAAASVGGLPRAAGPSAPSSFMSEPGGVEDAEGGEPTPHGVPRSSALRQPLDTSRAEFKALFRRSMEHLRGQLASTSGADAAAVARSPSPTAGQSAAPGRPPLVPRGARVGGAQQSAPGAPPRQAAGSTRFTSAPGGALPAAGYPGPELEATLGAVLSQQMAAAATAAAAELEASARAADDVELEAHLSAGAPERTANVSRLPDPAAPAYQLPRSASGGSQADAVGEFLAALAEPVVAVAGLFIPPPMPQRSIVIEEVTDEAAEVGAGQRARPSRVPGYAAQSAGGVAAGWGEGEEDESEEVSPRAHSEASMPTRRLRLHRPVVPGDDAASRQQQQQQQLSRSAAASPLPSSQQHAPVAAVSTSMPSHPLGPSRLKMASTAGAGQAVIEDRPLSSFAASEGGRAITPPRRRTPSPGPRPRASPPASPPLSSVQRSAAVPVSGEPVGPATARVAAVQPVVTEPPHLDEIAEAAAAAAAAARAAAAEAAEAADLAAATRGLEDLEAYLAAFKSRIGADVALASHGGSSSQPDTLESASSASTALVPLPAGALRASMAGSAAGSATSAAHGSLVTGYNLHTIRASAASALAAAAAVEQTFSPRPDEEAEAQLQRPPVVVESPTKAPPAPAAERSSGGASVVSSAATNASAATGTTNPVLREHLDHFQV